HSSWADPGASASSLGRSLACPRRGCGVAPLRLRARSLAPRICTRLDPRAVPSSDGSLSARGGRGGDCAGLGELLEVRAGRDVAGVEGEGAAEPALALDGIAAEETRETYQHGAFRGERVGVVRCERERRVDLAF